MWLKGKEPLLVTWLSGKNPLQVTWLAGVADPLSVGGGLGFSNCAERPA